MARSRVLRAIVQDRGILTVRPLARDLHALMPALGLPVYFVPLGLPALGPTVHFPPLFVVPNFPPFLPSPVAPLFPAPMVARYRSAASLLRLSGRHIAIAPAGLAAVVPSRRPMRRRGARHRRSPVMDAAVVKNARLCRLRGGICAPRMWVPKAPVVLGWITRPSGAAHDRGT